MHAKRKCCVFFDIYHIGHLLFQSNAEDMSPVKNFQAKQGLASCGTKFGWKPVGSDAVVIGDVTLET